MKVTSKIGNAALLEQDEQLRKHIPQVQTFSQSNLQNMLQTFSSVYIKPDNSAQGKGILRVDIRSNGSYALRSRDADDTWFHADFDKLWIDINRIRRERSYIMQQGIKSVTKAGEPFDIRVHMTRINRKWMIAGIIGRVAPVESVVTNYFLDGPSTFVSHLLTYGLNLSSQQAQRIMNELKSISYAATHIMSNAFPKWSEFGLDIGIDPEHKLWIYEINITPGASVFKKLGRESYLRIINLRKKAK